MVREKACDVENNDVMVRIYDDDVAMGKVDELRLSKDVADSQE